MHGHRYLVYCGMVAIRMVEFGAAKPKVATSIPGTITTSIRCKHRTCIVNAKLKLEEDL